MENTARLLRLGLNEIQCEFGSRNVGATRIESAELLDLP